MMSAAPNALHRVSCKHPFTACLPFVFAGALYSDSSEITIDGNVSFVHNKAGGKGGERGRASFA